MEFRSLNNKQLSGDRLRLTEPTIIFPDNIEIIAEHTVDVTEVGRIDVIANLYYEDENDSELILKFNNISNPFSITEGDILLIPNNETPLLNWETVRPLGEGSDEDLGIKDQFVNTKRLSQKDSKRVEYLKRKAASIKNGSSEILPPNIIKSNERNINIENGEIDINGTK